MLFDAPRKILYRFQVYSMLNVFWIGIWSLVGQWSDRIWPYWVMLAPMTPMVAALYVRNRLYSLEAELPWVIWRVRPGDENRAPEVALQGSARTEWLARKACDWNDRYGTQEEYENARYQVLEEWLNEEER